MKSPWVKKEVIRENSSQVQAHVQGLSRMGKPAQTVQNHIVSAEYLIVNHDDSFSEIIHSCRMTVFRESVSLFPL